MASEMCECGHARNQHNYEKCTWPGCTCPKSNMDFSNNPGPRTGPRDPRKRK